MKPRLEGMAPTLRELEQWSRRFELQEAAVLINIPQVRLELLDPAAARNRRFFAYPPHALLYLGACFKKLGMPHHILDLNYAALRAAQDEHPDIRGLCRSRLREAIHRYRKPLVCVSFMFDSTWPEFSQICGFIKAEFPGLCLAAGGVAATADPEAIIEKGLADIVFLHEGEPSLEGFYRFLRGGGEPVNLVFKDGDGAIRATPSVSGGPVDMDIRREYELIPIARYHQAGSISNFSRMNGVDVPFSPVLAKRGCRGSCAFCGVRGFCGKGVRLRGHREVVDEMAHLREKHGIEHFDWLDDDLLFDRTETLALFDEMASRLPGITWAANNGLIVSSIDDDLYKAFRRSGCIGFKVGLESGNAEILKRVRKPASVAQFLRFARLARGYPDIFVVVNFILGLPDERFGQMLDSLSVALKSRLHWHSFFMYQPIKNTELSPGRPEPWRDPRDTDLNPARGGLFRDFRLAEGAPTGYEVFDIDQGGVPPRAWIPEIWFAFNTVANFLLNPCLRCESPAMLKAMISWLEMLHKAYPEDALMACTNHYLKSRLKGPRREGLETSRAAAAALLKDPYWSFREKQFGFSSFLDGRIPDLPEKLGRLRDPKED
ncbi:MAG: radical SAM protein [Elusimicrobia bacterium]|nr:radical SAM protein [Elusimicrobiota bacterium]